MTFIVEQFMGVKWRVCFESTGDSVWDELASHRVRAYIQQIDYISGDDLRVRKIDLANNDDF